ncbi:hypothetical protein SAMN05444156_0067 [Verrucomicrobium sp. GAS474]|uniref:hypothetical protein n=1 Tax=Verrucomicrobium sp. GAS474 TaxID=1882831 RepID=UPI00087DC243|nr:hypothetical protein [Verrucomicrobium sp. GAS474]SDT85877.1 hypothetical protein SAMN05444156_0067 [Verrucomicrobium sp. GAS474]
MKKFSLLFVIALGLAGAFFLYQFGPLHFGPVTVKGNLGLYAPFDPAQSSVFLGTATERDLFQARLSPDGTFIFRHVPPGTYRLDAAMRDKDGDPAAHGAIRSFTIPSHGRSPFVTGPLSWHVFTPIKVGTIAPEYNFRTPDGVDHRLSEYRGKWVLVHFYNFMLDEKGPPQVPALRAADAAFGKRPDFVLLSLHVASESRDQPSLPEIRGDGMKNRIPWTLGDGEPPKLSGYYPPFGRPNLLLIAPDGTLAARDLAAEAVSTTLTAKLPPLPPPSTPTKVKSKAKK